MPLFGRGKNQVQADDPTRPLMSLGDKKNRVELWSNKVTIHHSGMLNAVNVGLTGDKDIYLDRITGVQVKKPGMTTGYIQFAVQGHEAKGGVTGAVQDENTITFKGKKEYEVAVQMKDRVEAMMRQSASAPVAASSLADELGKLAALRDQGILTLDEFEAQKRAMLG